MKRNTYINAMLWLRLQTHKGQKIQRYGAQFSPSSLSISQNMWKYILQKQLELAQTELSGSEIATQTVM